MDKEELRRGVELNMRATTIPGSREFLKTVPLGKVDYYGHGKKINKVDMNVALRQKDCGLAFSVCANVWNSRHTDIVEGGQCVDIVAALVKGTKYEEKASFLLDMWNKYHLNDMHAGTPAQEAVLDEAVKSGALLFDGANNYKQECEYLESKGMLVDKEYVTDKYPDGYKYGHGWLFEEIPERDLCFIEEFMLTGEVPKDYAISKEKCGDEALEEEQSEEEKEL